MKAALYARVSKSLESEGQNPENQLIRLRDFAHVRGYDETVEYVDYSSGADPNRPSLTKLMEDARHRRFTDIIVIKLDRIMRSTINLLEIVENLNEWNVGLICVDQPIETKTSMGKFVYSILAAVAEFERDLISERTRDGIERARRDGKVIGRPRVEIDMAQANELLSLGHSIRKVSEIMDVPYSTLRNRINE